MTKQDIINFYILHPQKNTSGLQVQTSTLTTKYDNNQEICGYILLSNAKKKKNSIFRKYKRICP